jgi:hypothetical protein
MLQRVQHSWIGLLHAINLGLTTTLWNLSKHPWSWRMQHHKRQGNTDCKWGHAHHLLGH